MVEPEVVLTGAQVVGPRPAGVFDVIEGKVVQLLHGALLQPLETLQLPFIKVFHETKVQLMELEALDETVGDLDGRFDHLDEFLKLTVVVPELNHVPVLDGEHNLQGEGLHDTQSCEEAVERPVVVELVALLEVLEPDLGHLGDAVSCGEKQKIREKPRFRFVLAVLMEICDLFEEILLAGVVSLDGEAGVEQHVQAQSVVPNQPVFVAHELHRGVKALQNDVSLLNPFHVHQQTEQLRDDLKSENMR